jgi:hypothetical protein
VDIAEWLRALGLGQYAPAYAENAVHWDVLPKLTADDLREIGVATVGDRRRLLEAIASLASSEAPTLVAAPRQPGGAERRQLTVMFCDLVGSTALAGRLDPEDLRDVIGAYHATVAEEAGRFGGFVAKYMGDGVLLYFGYPHAQEDDAERAVRAGLALVPRLHFLRRTKADSCHIASDATLAGAFVARWCAGYKVESTDGAFQIREDAPTTRTLPSLHQTP